jgi:hypothetical protein
MRWLFAWVGFGAAFQLFVWFHSRRRMGRFSVEVVFDSMTRGSVWMLLWQVLGGCLYGPLGPLLMLIPRRVIQKIYQPEIDLARERLRGRCPDCGEPLEGHEHTVQIV